MCWAACTDLNNRDEATKKIDGHQLPDYMSELIALKIMMIVLPGRFRASQTEPPPSLRNNRAGSFFDPFFRFSKCRPPTLEETYNRLRKAHAYADPSLLPSLDSSLTV